MTSCTNVGAILSSLGSQVEHKATLVQHPLLATQVLEVRAEGERRLHQRGGDEGRKRCARAPPNSAVIQPVTDMPSGVQSRV